MRLFIAVSVSEEVRENIAALQARLSAVPADVRWAEREKFHLTLKFLGEVAEEKAGAVERAVAAAARTVPPFTLSFAGLGAFPSRTAPRVIWIGVRDGAAELERLAANIDEELPALGFEKEKRKFSAHLTLGRVRSRQNIGLLAKRIASLEGAGAGSCPVTGVELMQSFLHPKGSRYQCLRSISL